MTNGFTLTGTITNTTPCSDAAHPQGHVGRLAGLEHRDRRLSRAADADEPVQRQEPLGLRLYVDQLAGPVTSSGAAQQSAAPRRFPGDSIHDHEQYRPPQPGPNLTESRLFENPSRLLASYSGFRGRRAISEVPRHTSTLPQRLGRLNTQRSARRCGARQHAHGRHDDGRDHRRDEEIRGQAVGAPREEQDEAVAGDDAAAELTTGTGEHATRARAGGWRRVRYGCRSRGCDAPRRRP